MRFSELLNRLTGFSCPVFGISWNPKELNRTVAYSDCEYESVLPCITSVTDIKYYLTSELQQINNDSTLNSYIRAMRNACNKFLSKCPDNEKFRQNAIKTGYYDNWVFISAIGEMRGLFGVIIGQIAKAYGLDVEDDLAQIIPE